MSDFRKIARGWKRGWVCRLLLSNVGGRCRRFNHHRRTTHASATCSSCLHHTTPLVLGPNHVVHRQLCADCEDVVLVPFDDMGKIGNLDERHNNTFIGWSCRVCEYVHENDGTGWPKDCLHCRPANFQAHTLPANWPAWRRRARDVLHVLPIRYD